MIGLFLFRFLGFSAKFANFAVISNEILFKIANGLKCLLRFHEKEKKEKNHQETAYYIGSVNQEVSLLFREARRHWQLENSLHWRMDVIFGQDESQYRDRIGARNLAVYRKLVLICYKRK